MAKAPTKPDPVPPARVQHVLDTFFQAVANRDPALFLPLLDPSFTLTFQPFNPETYDPKNPPRCAGNSRALLLELIRTQGRGRMRGERFPGLYYNRFGKIWRYQVMYSPAWAVSLDLHVRKCGQLRFCALAAADCT